MQHELIEKQPWVTPKLLLLGRGDLAECLIEACRTFADPEDECHSFSEPNQVLVAS